MTLAPNARAFCRTMTGREENDPPDTHRCDDWRVEERGSCCPYGKPLYWKNACVGFSLQKDASQQVPLGDAERIVADAFAAWTGITCGAEGESSQVDRVGIDLRYQGTVACGKAQYNRYGPNQHVIVFRDQEWEHADGSRTLAITTVQYDPTTGELLDADMELNTAQHTLSIKNLPSNGYDLASIVTHEAGHFLGFSHSADTAATMYATYRPGTVSMRQPKADDAAGICGVYTPDQKRVTAAGTIAAEACDPTPLHGLTGECDTDSPPSDSCSAAPSHRHTASDFGPIVASIAILGGVFARRKRNRSRATGG